jgi:predicted ester cyclase
MNVERDAVHKFHDESLKMLLAGNVGCFSEEGQWLPPNAPLVEGKNSIGEIVSQVIEDPNFSASHEIVDIKVSSSGDLAYIHYTYELTVSDPAGKPDSDYGKGIYVLQKQQQAGWKFLIDIWNSDAEIMHDTVAVPKQVTDSVQTEVQNKEVVRRYWDGKWNKRRPEILDELQNPDVQYHSPSMQMNGIEEYKQVYGMYLSALHDTQLTIEELVAEGDKVMSRVSVKCTHKGELDGIPPTGNSLTVKIFTVFRLVGGKIAEEWELVDELGLMHQLGMELGP